MSTTATDQSCETKHQCNANLAFFQAPYPPMPPLRAMTNEPTSSNVESVLLGVESYRSRNPHAQTTCAVHKPSMIFRSWRARALAASTSAKPGSRV